MKTAALPSLSLVKPIKWTGILKFWSLYRQRRDLASLDDHLLEDIGVSRSEAQREAARSMWDAPHFWSQ